MDVTACKVEIEQMSQMLQEAQKAHDKAIAKMKEYARAEGVSAGFGVDSELVSDLSRGIGVSGTAEYWKKVQHTSARPHVDLIPGGNGLAHT